MNKNRIMSLVMSVFVLGQIGTMSVQAKETNLQIGNKVISSVDENKQDSVVVLTDNANIRVARSVVDGITTTVTYYKKSGDFKFESNGKVTIIQGQEILKEAYNQNKMSLAASSSSRELNSSNDIRSLGYKKYYDSEEDNYYWDLNGPGWFSSKGLYESRSNVGKIEEFVKYVDKASDLWDTTKGMLLAAGGGAVVAALLALIPEPIASKGAAVAALTAAGASAGVALGAGGTYYAFSQAYHKAEDAYDNI